MANSVIITRIIEGGATLPQTPAAQRNFHNTCFIWNGAKKGEQRINYFGTDISAITETFGSNSEVVKAAKTFLAGGFSGNTPKEFYVGNIDVSNSELVATEAVYTLADNTLTISGSTMDKFSDVNPVYAVWTINGERVEAYGKYTNDSDHKLKLYATKTDVEEDNAIVLSEAPYSLADSDETSTAVVYKESFVDGLNEILDDSTVYHLILDNTFSEEQKKLFISLVETSSTTHAGYILDTSADAKYKKKDTDENSLLHYASNAKFSKTLVVVDDEDKKDEYKNASACSYYAQVNWTSSSPMGSLVFKTMAGITPSKFSEGGIVSTSSAWDNVIAKNGNCYTDFSTVNAPAWYKGVAPNGNQFGEIIAKDFVLYQCDYNLFYMLQSQSKLPMTEGGAVKIAQTLSIGLQKLYESTVIAGGTAEDGTVFPSNGYIVNVQVPTGASKQQGIWENVKAEALLSGTTTKITYQIQFKQ